MEETWILERWPQYMKKNAESDKPFTLNKHVRERLDQWDEGIKRRFKESFGKICQGKLSN